MHGTDSETSVLPSSWASAHGRMHAVPFGSALGSQNLFLQEGKTLLKMAIFMSPELEIFKWILIKVDFKEPVMHGRVPVRTQQYRNIEGILLF